MAAASSCFLHIVLSLSTNRVRVVKTFRCNPFLLQTPAVQLNSHLSDLLQRAADRDDTRVDVDRLKMRQEVFNLKIKKLSSENYGLLIIIKMICTCYCMFLYDGEIGSKSLTPRWNSGQCPGSIWG